MKRKYRFATEEEIFKLLHLILCDDAPPMADAAVIHGETYPNKESLLKTLKNLWQLGKIYNIAISNFTGSDIAPGFLEMKHALMKMEVPKDEIFAFPLSNKFPPGTDAEAWGLVPFAQTRGWRDLYLVAPPLHLFRMFYSNASAIIMNGKSTDDIRLWGYPTDIRGWNEVIIHSQSVPKDHRMDQLLTELNKVDKYFRKHDLVSARKVLDYMKKRY